MASPNDLPPGFEDLPPGFEADAASVPILDPSKRETVGLTESGARGALQGVSMGWGDEGAAAIAATLPFTDREATAPTDARPGDTWGDRYERARDYYRMRNAVAEEANPKTYFAGQVGGAVAPSLVGAAPATGVRGLLTAAGQGVTQGAGYSDADVIHGDVSGLASDSALGGLLGTAGYGTGALLGKGASALKRKGAELLARGEQRAASQAADEVAEKIASARGEFGAETQKGSRFIENMMRLEESMTPEQRMTWEALKSNGVVPDLQRSVAQGTLDRLPGQAATIAEKRAALQALEAEAPKAVADRTGQLLTPQVKADIQTFLKAYAEPIAWAYGTKKGVEALGGDQDAQYGAAAVAGLLGGRTRAGKALWNRVTRPAHQAALGRGAQQAGSAVETFLPIAGRAAPAAAATLAPTTASATGQRVVDVLEANPAAFGAYGPQIAAMAEKYGPEGAAAAFYVLSRDPRAKDQLEAALTAGDAP